VCGHVPFPISVPGTGAKIAIVIVPASMFKKSLGSLKTSGNYFRGNLTRLFKCNLNSFIGTAPLRSSDRRKLKQRVVQLFPEIPPEDEQLVPDGLLSVKFSTHLEEPGVSVDLSMKNFWLISRWTLNELIVDCLFGAEWRSVVVHHGERLWWSNSNRCVLYVLDGPDVPYGAPCFG